MDELRILTPGCPLCGQDPVTVLGGGRQAWCGNGDCTILCWDATKSLDENLLDAHHVRLTSTEGDL